MRIGIDFDNTLVCYDQLFWKLARDRDLIGPSVPQRKDAVRDDLRRRNLEPDWTRLQGEAYGPRILEAMPFPGVHRAFEEFRLRNWIVFVISHKTRMPFAGEPHDLHAAARNWLFPSPDAEENPLTPTLSPQGRGEGARIEQRASDAPILNPSCDADERPVTPTLSPQSRGELAGLTLDRVYLELTKQEKLRRIADLKCDVFIDDLPELLLDSEFPKNVRRVLFDPHRQFGALPGIWTFHAWSDVVEVLSLEAAP